MSGLSYSYREPSVTITIGKDENIDKYINFSENPYVIIEVEADHYYPSNKVILTGLFNGEVKYCNHNIPGFNKLLRDYEYAITEDGLYDYGWDKLKSEILDDNPDFSQDMIDKIKSAEFPSFNNLELLDDGIKEECILLHKDSIIEPVEFLSE